jgi:surfactin synthase thioesterase subunit
MTSATGSWFRDLRPRGGTNIRLFCFPYAGGSALVYRDWADLLPSTIHVVPVELPGRGLRLRESPFTEMQSLIDVLAEEVAPLLDLPFAFFGHSMGAVIAFELTRALRRRYGRHPRILFLSGRPAPQLSDEMPISYNLPKDEFIAQLRRLKGTSQEVLENMELMELVIPLLRADFKLIQTYKYLVDEPLSCPIIVYGGSQDREAPIETMFPWKEHTSSDFALHPFPGDHFYLRPYQALLLKAITQELLSITASMIAETLH